MKAHISERAAVAGAVVIASIIIGELLIDQEITEEQLEELESIQPYLAKIGSGDVLPLRKRKIPHGSIHAANRLCAIIDELLLTSEITADVLEDLEQLAPHINYIVA